jgi:hypothetical protein
MKTSLRVRCSASKSMTGIYGEQNRLVRKSSGREFASNRQIYPVTGGAVSTKTMFAYWWAKVKLEFPTIPDNVEQYLIYFTSIG